MRDLNGIPLQLLDGIEDSRTAGLTPEMRAGVLQLQQIGKAHEINRQLAIQAASRGLNNRTLDGFDTVSRGYDFAGFGEDDDSDDEMIRDYLQRTKETIDAVPDSLCGYGDSTTMSRLLGFVLDKWDTEEREDALDTATAIEEKLIAAGKINPNVAGDQHDVTLEEVYTPDAYTYSDGTVQGMYDYAAAENAADLGSFFKRAKRATGNKSLTAEAKNIVDTNPATKKSKGRFRKLAKRLRTSAPKTVRDEKTGKVKTIMISVVPSRKTMLRAEKGVSGLGRQDDMELLMRGTEMEYGVNGLGPDGALLSIKNYLTRTRNYIVANPLECFDSVEEAQAYANIYNRLLASWESPKMRDQLLTLMEQGGVEGLCGLGSLGALNGRLRKKLRKAFKKVGSAVKKAVKKVGTAVKKVGQAVKKGMKKLGKAIKKVAKKVWKFIVRFNPVTFLIRAGILGACRLNMFKLANKCYPGSLSKAEALKMGVSEAEWTKSNKAYGHLKNAYTKLGGKESKLKSTLKKGNKKKWQGAEYPTDGNSIKAAAKATPETKDEAKETINEQTEARKEMVAKGAVADKTVSADTASVTVKTEVEVIENERTTKAATQMRETGEDSGKLVVNVPKGAKVLVDTKQADATWIAATYGKSTGYVKKTALAGLGDVPDYEDYLICGLSGLYEEGIIAPGLGCEPATMTAITAATSVIAGVMSKIKTIFGTAKGVVDDAKDTINAGKSIVKNPKGAITQVQKMANKYGGEGNAVSKGLQTAQQKAQNVVNQGRQMAQTAKAAAVNKVATQARQVVQKAQTAKASAVNKVATRARQVVQKAQTAKAAAVNKVATQAKQAAQKAKAATTPVKQAATQAKQVAQKAKAATTAVRQAATQAKQVAQKAKAATTPVKQAATQAKQVAQKAKAATTPVKQAATQAKQVVQKAKAATAPAQQTAASNKTTTQQTTAKPKAATAVSQTTQQPTATTAKAAATPPQQTAPQQANTAASDTGSGNSKKLLIVGGIAALLAGGIYLATRKKQ